jgi:hypothetical protein
MNITLQLAVIILWEDKLGLHNSTALRKLEREEIFSLKTCIIIIICNLCVCLNHTQDEGSKNYMS